MCHYPCTSKLSNGRLPRHHLQLQNRNPNFPQTLAATMTHHCRQPPSAPPHLFVHVAVTPPSSIFSTILPENSSAITPLSLYLAQSRQPSQICHRQPRTATHHHHPSRLHRNSISTAAVSSFSCKFSRTRGEEKLRHQTPPPTCRRKTQQRLCTEQSSPPFLQNLQWQHHNFNLHGSTAISFFQPLQQRTQRTRFAANTTTVLTQI